MTRRFWIPAFLAVTAIAIGLELVAALDSSTATVPWTYLVRDYVPWPVTAAAITVLVVWLPVHFYQAYRRRPAAALEVAVSTETSVTEPPVPPDPTDHRTDPLLLRAAFVAIAGAVLTVVAAFGLDLSRGQREAIIGAVAVIGPIVLGIWARRHVYSPQTVNTLLTAAKTPAPVEYFRSLKRTQP